MVKSSFPRAHVTHAILLNQTNHFSPPQSHLPVKTIQRQLMAKCSFSHPTLYEAARRLMRRHQPNILLLLFEMDVGYYFTNSIYIFRTHRYLLTPAHRERIYTPWYYTTYRSTHRTLCHW